MQNDGSATGNDHNLSNTSNFEDYLPKDVSSIYPPFNPYREPARSSLMEYQGPINLTVQCLTRLRDTTREVETLRLENETLRSANQELQNHLGHLIQASVEKLCLSSSATAAGDDYNRGTVMKKAPFEDASSFLNSFDSGGGDKVAEDESPTSVMEPVTFPLPKSISVRSREYLKMSRAPAAASSVVGASKIRSLTRSSRIASPLNASKVYVSQGKKDQEEPLELEVYNQGMRKTELCNKWQETGACPYGDNCQFAHGIQELCPVIRHPRYKTEVCRMVLSGEICPYGHRCHFHHALTEQEKLQRFLKPHGQPSNRGKIK